MLTLFISSCNDSPTLPTNELTTLETRGGDDLECCSCCPECSCCTEYEPDIEDDPDGETPGEYFVEYDCNTFNIDADTLCYADVATVSISFDYYGDEIPEGFDLFLNTDVVLRPECFFDPNLVNSVEMPINEWLSYPHTRHELFPEGTSNFINYSLTNEYGAFEPGRPLVAEGLYYIIIYFDVIGSYTGKLGWTTDENGTNFFGVTEITHFQTNMDGQYCCIPIYFKDC